MGIYDWRKFHCEKSREFCFSRVTIALGRCGLDLSRSEPCSDELDGHAFLSGHCIGPCGLDLSWSEPSSDELDGHAVLSCHLAIALGHLEVRPYGSEPSSSDELDGMLS